MPGVLHLTPTLHTVLGWPMPHEAVLEELGDNLLRGLAVESTRSGVDHLCLVTGWRTHDRDGAPLVRVTIKLAVDGAYTLERGHVDTTSSVATYRVDQQVHGLAFDQLAECVPAIVVGAIASDLGRPVRAA